MALSSSTARYGMVRALARSTTKLSSTPSTAPRRSLSSFRLPPATHQHQLRRQVTLPTTRGLWSVAVSPRQQMQQQQQQQQEQQRRSFASGKDDDDSDDDFKPKRKAVPDDTDEVSDLIKKQVESNPVMLYMKGTPAQPQCGFSKQVVSILHSQGKKKRGERTERVSFSSVNVLDYPPLREGIKAFSDWPTIPQLYVKGEFVGGCDILTQLHTSGDLETMLKEAKLRN
ncbi:unnamed protein product [Pylaiella littoralis]